PTLAVAGKIAGGLELRLSQLLRLDEGGAVTVTRAHDARPAGGDPAAGHRYEVLTAPLPGQRAELSRHVLAAGGATGTPATRPTPITARRRPRSGQGLRPGTLTASLPGGAGAWPADERRNRKDH